jgi:tetratricopeptide (TPR) repeat protein
LAAGLLAVALGAGMLAAITVPYVAARHARAAVRGWEADPAAAYSQVRAATALLPFDQQLYLLGGSIALNRGEHAPARAWLLEAERHDEDNWLTPFALGLVEGEAGRRRAARRQLERARRLNPLEATIRVALEGLRKDRPLSFEEAQESLAPRIVAPGSSP